MTAIEFKNWVTLNKDVLYRFAYSILLDSHYAQDIVQDVLIKLWLQGDKTYQIKSLEAWCFTVTKNKCLNKLKKLSYQNKTQILYKKENYNPNDYLEAKELEHIIENIMLRLNGIQRAIMHLRDYEELDYSSISERLDITVSNVKIQVHRARKFIKETLQKEYGYEQDF